MNRREKRKRQRLRENRVKELLLHTIEAIDIEQEVKILHCNIHILLVIRVK